MLDDIPDDPKGQAEMLEGILLAACEGNRSQNPAYAELRSRLMAEPALKPLLPDFVLTCRTLDAFWPRIKAVSPHWAPRRAHVSDTFTPLMDQLEGTHRSPGDTVASDVLQKFNADGVNAIWKKALDRRHTDIDGAITIARTLLETVFKHVLDDAGIEYDDKEELPPLYRKVQKTLNLAPDQHTEEIFKQILGGCASVVQGLGSIRSKIGDAHGRGKGKARASDRHAKLAVNLAGSMASFIVETYVEKHKAGE